MAKQIIGIGAVSDDGTGDSLRDGMDKVNDNFTELYDADVLLAPIASPTFTGTVGGVTKAMVGLTDADDTSDADKPVSNLQAAALDDKSPLLSNITSVASPTANIGMSNDIIHVTYTSTGVVTLTVLTANIVAGGRCVIKDSGGKAGTNNITIVGQSGETIDGSASAVLTGDYNAINLYSDGTNLFIY